MTHKQGWKLIKLRKWIGLMQLIHMVKTNFEPFDSTEIDPLRSSGASVDSGKYRLEKMEHNSKILFNYNWIVPLNYLPVKEQQNWFRGMRKQRSRKKRNRNNVPLVEAFLTKNALCINFILDTVSTHVPLALEANWFRVKKNHERYSAKSTMGFIKTRNSSPSLFPWNCFVSNIPK